MRARLALKAAKKQKAGKPPIRIESNHDIDAAAAKASPSSSPPAASSPPAQPQAATAAPSPGAARPSPKLKPKLVSLTPSPEPTAKAIPAPKMPKMEPKAVPARPKTLAPAKMAPKPAEKPASQAADVAKRPPPEEPAPPRRIVAPTQVEQILEKGTGDLRLRETAKARISARRQSQEVQDKTQQDLVREVLELGGVGTLGSAGRGSVGLTSVGRGLEHGSAEAIGEKERSGLRELLNFRGSQGSSVDMKFDTEASYKEERRNTEASQQGTKPRPDSNAQLFMSKPNLKPKTPLKELRTGRMKSNVIAGILNDAQRTETAGGGESGKPQR